MLLFTVLSTKKAEISTDEMQGGRASVFINDDGMQLTSPNDAESEGIIMKSTESARLLGQNITPANCRWRPFVRAGKLK